MARGDIDVLFSPLGVLEFDVEDRNLSGTHALLSGEPLKRGGTGNNFAKPVDTGDPEIGTDIMLGIAENDSTETATVDGKVNVYLAGPGTLIEGKATTAGNADTASEIIGFRNNYVAFDVDGSSNYTIDENEGKQKIKLYIV